MWECPLPCLDYQGIGAWSTQPQPQHRRGSGQTDIATPTQRRRPSRTFGLSFAPVTATGGNVEKSGERLHLFWSGDGIASFQRINYQLSLWISPCLTLTHPENVQQMRPRLISLETCLFHRFTVMFLFFFVGSIGTISLEEQHFGVRHAENYWWIITMFIFSSQTWPCFFVCGFLDTPKPSYRSELVLHSPEHLPTRFSMKCPQTVCCSFLRGHPSS